MNANTYSLKKNNKMKLFQKSVIHNYACWLDKKKVNKTFVAFGDICNRSKKFAQLLKKNKIIHQLP